MKIKDIPGVEFGGFTDRESHFLKFIKESIENYLIEQKEKGQEYLGAREILAVVSEILVVIFTQIPEWPMEKRLITIDILRDYLKCKVKGRIL